MNPETEITYSWFKYHPFLNDKLNRKIKALKTINNETVSVLAEFLFESFDLALEVDDDTLAGVVVAYFSTQIDFRMVALQLMLDVFERKQF